MGHCVWSICFLVILAIGDVVICGEDSHTTIASVNTTNTTTITVQSATEKGPKLKAIPCQAPKDCKNVDGAYCDVDQKLCLCKPDYPVTDTNQCYKVSKYDEFCQLDIQCQYRDKNSKCNRDFSLCECQNRYVAKSYSDGQQWCIVPNKSQVLDTSVGSHLDPTMIGIMCGLILMFIVICVVLQLFAKAQFQENRSIFNTPNPRLMNVSLLKERGGEQESAATIASTSTSGGVSSRKKSMVSKPRRTSSVMPSSAPTTNPNPAMDEILESEDQILTTTEIKDSQA